MANGDTPAAAPAGKVLWSGFSHNAWERDWFGPCILVGFLAFILLGFFRSSEFPGDTLGVIIGYMASWVKDVVAFKYGSTQGSRAKDATIRDLGKNAQTLAGTTNGYTT